MADVGTLSHKEPAPPLWTPLVSRTPRCLVSSLDQPEMDASTIHHLGRVLRLQPGAPLELIDGSGGLVRASWTGSARPDLEEQPTRQPPVRDPFWLAVAPPRPSRLDWLVEKAAELGVNRLLLIHTLHTARSVKATRIERLQRKAHEALLQCRRLHALTVVPERPLAAVLEESARSAADLWAAEAPEDPDRVPPEEADSLSISRTEQASPPSLPPRTPDKPLLAVIGPEGGLSTDERDLLASHQAQRINLGSGVLRVETAALALAARLCR